MVSEVEPQLMRKRSVGLYAAVASARTAAETRIQMANRALLIIGTVI